MKWTNIIRAKGWEYQLPPLLGIGYATILNLGGQIYDYWRWLFIILLSLITGIVYGSIINNTTVLKDDHIAGKKNRMLNMPVCYRWLLSVLCLLLGLFFEYTVYYPDMVSMILYAVPWLLFSCCSFPPFHLKNRGIASMLCNTGGSYVFTSLLLICSISFIMSQSINNVWLILTGTWAFCYGLRSLLPHQYTDRENNIHSGRPAVTIQTPSSRSRLTATIIFTVELLATLGIFLYLSNPWIIITYAFYVLLCFLRWRFSGREPAIVSGNSSSPQQIVQQDYFQCIFPLTLLIYATIIDKDNLLPLLFHLILFPGPLIRLGKDLKQALNIIIRK